MYYFLYIKELNKLIASFLPSIIDIKNWVLTCVYNSNITYELYHQIEYNYLQHSNKNIIYKNIKLNPNIQAKSVRKFKDVSSLVCNKYVTDYCLQQLTSITYLDINNNNKITNKGIGYLSELKYLFIGENCKIDNVLLCKNLISIDFGLNKNIFYIPRKVLNMTINSSPISNDSFKYNDQISTLICENNIFLTDDILLYLPNLKVLNVGYNPYDHFTNSYFK